MLNVLIVEDDPMVAEINRQYLEMTEGFTLAGIVPDGGAALRFLESASVSLLLLDVFMPNMDGLSLLRELREKHPSVDVIMVTAARSGADIQTALRLGVIDYIVKPFTLARFQAALIVYQERVRLLKDGDELDQEQLDKGIFALKDPVQGTPKGIDSATLKLVKDKLEGYGREFSVKEMALLTGLSRVSLKKYLEYLEACGHISGSLVHMPVGRPVKRYRLSPTTGKDAKKDAGS